MTKTFLELTKECSLTLPERYRDEDVRFPDGMVEHFIGRFTREGDLVFDPFAGFGTALVVAERMGRRAFGVEIDRSRAEYIRSCLAEPGNIVLGDSRSLLSLGLPQFDLCVTSPPYPHVGRGRDNDPLAAYTGAWKGYGAYIDELAGIFGQARHLMKDGAHVVVEAGNLKLEAGISTFAWDVAGALSKVLTFRGETVACWDAPDFGYDHTYCMVFSR
jgi:DNA modification methylase